MWRIWIIDVSRGWKRTMGILDHSNNFNIQTSFCGFELLVVEQNCIVEYEVSHRRIFLGRGHRISGSARPLATSWIPNHQSCISMYLFTLSWSLQSGVSHIRSGSWTIIWIFERFPYSKMHFWCLNVLNCNYLSQSVIAFNLKKITFLQIF